MMTDGRPPLTLRQGLVRYYEANPHFVQNQDLWVGWIRVPWVDLQKHDIMHVVTGYGTHLADELRLIGFLLTALTWRRPWYFYLQSVGVFGELLGRSLLGRRFGQSYHGPWSICRHYWRGVRQGQRVNKKIVASLDPSTVLDRSLVSLRAEYGIANYGAWD